jgi:hypothetical protein
MIQRGDLSACSFAFIDGDVDWDFSDRSMPIRTVHSIRALFDLSCVADPAYSETEISARSIEDLEKTIEAEKAETEEVKETPEVKEEPKEQDTNEETTAPEVKETEGKAEEENREDDSYLEDLKPYKEILEKL